MDLLRNQLSAHQIQTSWKMCIEQYPHWQFGCIDNRVCQLHNGVDSTTTQTQRERPELLQTVELLKEHQYHIPPNFHIHNR